MVNRTKPQGRARPAGRCTAKGSSLNLGEGWRPKKARPAGSEEKRA